MRLALLTAPVLVLAGLAIAKPPATEKRPVVDEYFGTKVTDDYRWLESWDDPKVKAWSEAQNDYARAFLSKLPARRAIEARLRTLEGSQSDDWWGLDFRAGSLFAVRMAPPKQQPMLWVFAAGEIEGAAAESGKAVLGHAVVDPNELDPSGSTTIDFYVPSPDASKVAVSLSKNGTESGDVHVFDAKTGKELPGVVYRVNGGTAGGSLAWNEDGSGFWYTRYPHAGERPPEDLGFYQQVWFHRLGDPPEKDTYAIGREFPRIAEVVLSRSRSGKRILASVANGDGGEFEFWVLDAATGASWTKIAGFDDRVVRAAFGPGDDVFLLSHRDAPRGKIFRLVGTLSLEAAKVVVPASTVAIEDFAVTDHLVYTNDMVGGPSQMRVFDLGGADLGTVPILPFSAVEQIVPLDGDDVLFRNESYLAPPAWYRYRAAEKKAAPTALKTTSPASFADCEVTQEFATSRDGTKVPMLILRRKGVTANGKNPALLYGYGGFDVARTPEFLPWLRPWIEQGGIYVASNIRGGSEYGEEWHEAGKSTKKQNVFDDFYACAKHLVDAKWTKPKKLAIYGRSNGGLLMGAALVQHPEAYRAVVSKVGLYDMLRFEQSPNGVFIATEYGSVKNEPELRALLAWSPYQHVKDGERYPATLFMTGANDPRVDPMHSRKMTARLQAANAAKTPILLRTSSTSGHGGGHGNGTSLDERIGEDVDMFAFLFAELGVKYRSAP